MKILILDNYTPRHNAHQSFSKQFLNIEFIILEKMSLEELNKEKYNLYIIHKGNHQEYNYIYSNKLGGVRIFFSGGERNPIRTDHCIFTDTVSLYKELEDAIASNS